MATPILKRTDLRRMVRQKINGFPRSATTLSAAITDTTGTTITVTSAYDIVERCLLQVESEILQVVSVSGTTITVIRGAYGSTPATHSNGAAVACYPFWGWPDVALNDGINNAIEWLREMGCWTPVFKTNTWLANYKEFGMPAGFTYPQEGKAKRVELWDPNYGPTGDWRAILGWRHIADRIFINGQLMEDTDVRILVEQPQGRLTSDTTVLDSDSYAEPLVLYTSSRLLEELVANRTRFYEYSASLNDRASSPDELQRAAFFLQNQAIVLADKLSRPGLSGFASTYIE